jgi:hypothetical protein
LLWCIFSLLIVLSQEHYLTIKCCGSHVFVVVKDQGNTKIDNKLANKPIILGGLDFMKLRHKMPIQLSEYVAPILCWNWDYLFPKIFDVP